MQTQQVRGWIVLGVLALSSVGPALALDEKLPDSEVLMRALADEMTRSLKLQMEDLEKPYFVEYDVEDNVVYQLTADYGSITGSQRGRSREFRSRVRVGSPELDNTHFIESEGLFLGGGGSAQASLPIDDDYVAIRQAIWRVTDDDYKNAVETLTRKRAYMKDKNIVDRPNDFSPAPSVQKVEPTAELRFDQAGWEENLKQISAHFKKYAQVQESGARLFAGAGNAYVVNSEGTRLRTGDALALLIVTAAVQADDGMKLSASRSYTGHSTDDLPPVAKIIGDVDELVAELTAAMKAPIVEQYSGPVLFDDRAAAQLFRGLLAGGLVGKPDPVGEQRRAQQGAENLETKLGTRILPKSFQVWDDPTAAKFGQDILLGHYRCDDEAVPAARVDLVKDGKLEELCLSRAPTKKLSGSNGHARRAPSGGAPEPAIGCLFIRDDAGVPAAELKKKLIEAAKDAGLEYGVRIKGLRSTDATSGRADLLSLFMRMQRGNAGALGDPAVAYKVYVADGHEEPFRGCEFGPVEVAALKKIIAAGDTPQVYNYMGLGMGGATPPASIIAPPVLFEELELSKIQQEYDKPPLLAAPLFR